MNNPKITINLVVMNGEKYIRHCLDAVRSQTYENIQVNILDNNSSDNTKEIIKKEYPEFNLIESDFNFGLGGGMVELLKYTAGKYKVALCVDVLLDKNFCRVAVDTMEKNHRVGALQGKILRYFIEDGEVVRTNQIDTCGFKIFKSRRLINIGHGEEDSGQYDKEGEIFSFEGAAPVFRVEALEYAKINNELYDKDFFWYSDDIDLGWRMRLLGWSSYYTPSLLAIHDRQTTKSLRKSYFDFIKIRREVPMRKRRLDWRNLKLTFIKNDSSKLINFHFLKREFMLAGYLLLFEPKVLLEIPRIIKLLPKMLRKRRSLMHKAVIRPKELNYWFAEDVFIK